MVDVNKLIESVNSQQRVENANERIYDSDDSSSNSSYTSMKSDTSTNNNINMNQGGNGTASSELGTREILRDDDESWTSRVPYQVTFGDDFATMADALTYSIRTWGSYDKSTGKNGKNNADDLREFGNDSLEQIIGAPDYIDHYFFKDTCVGGNDAINCVWQFNRDDDILHPMNHSMSPSIEIGESRVYASTTDLNQTIAYFSFGVPRYTPLAKFYNDLFDRELIQLNTNGIKGNDNGYAISRLFGNTFATVFALPVIGAQWLYQHFNALNDLHINKLISLRLSMPMYYSYVDRMLAEWCVAVGIYGNGAGDSVGQVPQADGTMVGAGQENPFMGNVTASVDTVPVAMRAIGLSIWDIMSRKATNLGFQDFGKNGKYLYDKIEEMAQDSQLSLQTMHEVDGDNFDEIYSSKYGEFSGWVGDIVDMVKATALGATRFIGFRVEKDTDASESFSNSTKANPIVEKINSAISSASAKAQSAGGDAGTGIQTLDTAIEGISNFISGMADAFGVEGIAEAITHGAFVDAPEIYASSDFNKSHSLNFQLRSPYGTVASIYQSIMVPLFSLLAGALPRSAGKNTYMSPMLCAVYCKGIFCVPIGIIDSISVKRGSSEFGWTYGNLPTCVDVTVSIKDLSPAMYMSVQASGPVEEISGFLSGFCKSEDSLQEYILTLAGVGAFDRLSIVSRSKRKLKLIAHQIRNKYTNSKYWSMNIGSSAPITLYGNLSSQNMIPQ